MKFVIFTLSLIGGSFVGANLLGSVRGAVDIIPYVTDASDGFSMLADARIALARALNNTSNCGSSGSNTALLNVAKSTKVLSQIFLALAGAITKNTDHVDQLALLTGDLSQVTDGIHDAANALVSLSRDIGILAENINTESLYGVDEALRSIEDFTESSYAFYNALERFALLPSKLLLQLVALLNFTDSVHKHVESLEIEMIATAATEKRCNVSTGIPEALGELHDIGYKIYQGVKLLAT